MEMVCPKLWKGGVTSYLDRLHEFDKATTQKFFDGWKNETIKMEGKTINLSVELIAQFTVIPNEGLKFYRNQNIYDMAAKKFPKSKKEKEAFS